MKLERMDSTHFDWLAWRNGSIPEVFSVHQRESSIVGSADVLRKHAVGWCPSEQVPCRPKAGFVSVMFLTDDRMWWTHVTQKEFDLVFGEK